MRKTNGQILSELIVLLPILLFFLFLFAFIGDQGKEILDHALRQPRGRMTPVPVWNPANSNGESHRVIRDLERAFRASLGDSLKTNIFEKVTLFEVDFPAGSPQHLNEFVRRLKDSRWKKEDLTTEEGALLFLREEKRLLCMRSTEKTASLLCTLNGTGE